MLKDLYVLLLPYVIEWYLFIYVLIYQCSGDKGVMLQRMLPGESLSAIRLLGSCALCVLSSVLMTHLGRQDCCDKERKSLELPLGEKAVITLEAPLWLFQD